MTTEIETASLAVGSNRGDVSDTTITRDSDTSESISSNREQGHVWGGRTKRGGQQGCGGRGGRFNRPAHTSSISNFKGEMEDFGAVLGTTSEQIEAKYQYKKFIKKPKQYILIESQNPEDTIVLVRYLKDLTTILNTSRPTVMSAEDEKDPIMVRIQTEDIKQYAKKIQAYGKT